MLLLMCILLRICFVSSISMAGNSSTENDKFCGRKTILVGYQMMGINFKSKYDPIAIECGKQIILIHESITIVCWCSNQLF